MASIIRDSVGHELYLYHYTKVEVVINYILRSRTLRIGSLRSTNDPKESKDWVFNYALGGESPGVEETNIAGNAIANYIKDNSRVICFSKDKNCIGINPLNQIFSRGFAKPRMWAQYGANHAGVCLIFNKNILEIKMIEQFGGPRNEIYNGSVRYVNRSIVDDIASSAYTVNYPCYKELGLVEYTRRHLYTHCRRLLFEKSADWHSEDEYRWVVVSDDMGDLYLKFDDALVGIVFGEATSEHDISQIVNMAKGGGVQFEKMEWKNCTPWLSFRLTWA